MIKALIFDFDGLIVGTEGPDFQAWQETYASFGCTLPLAFEDSPNGALAATRAGIGCIVVSNRLTQQLAFDVANLRLTSLAELPLVELLARVDTIGVAQNAA